MRAKTLPSMDSASDSAPDCLPASPSLGITSLSEIAIQTDPVQETEADDPSLLELVSAMSAMNINQSVQASVSNMAPDADVDNVDEDVPYISFNGAILLLDRKDVKVITPSVIDEVTPTLLSTTSDVTPSDLPRKKRVRTRKAPTLATPSSSSDSTILNPSSSISNPPANTAIVSTKVETSEAPVHPAKAAQDFVEVSAQISEWQVVRRRTRRPNRSIVHHGAVEPAPAAGDVPSNANPSYPKSASTSAPPVVAVPSNQPLRVEHAPRMAIAGPSMQTSSERRHPSTSTSHNTRPTTSSYSRSSTSMHAPSVVNTPSNPSGPVELAPGMAIARGPLLQTSSENRHRSTYPPTSLSAHPMAMEPRPHESFTRPTALATPQEQSSRSSASSRWAPQTPPAQPSSSSSAASIWAPRTPHVSAFTFRHPSLPPRPEHPLGISSSMWAHGNLQSTEPVADPSEAPRTKRPTRRHGRGRFRPSRADRWAQQEPNQPHHDS
ncbi:hypothetical protein H0H93_005988 [Arthromyces matolae]|nr:hypothetical protein H0H93_005988 [Arthromyces matolae]